MKRIFRFLLGIALVGVASGDELRLVSYNIKHGEGMDGKIVLNRIAAVISRLKPDLVALQEVDVDCARSGNVDIPAELGKLLRMQPQFSKSIELQGGAYGVAVLSKLPVLRAIRHPLPGDGEPRTALEVQVNAGKFAEILSFVSIHNDWRSEEVRLGQVNAVVHALQGRTHPIILAGDFNAESTALSMQPFSVDPWCILDKKGSKTCPADAPESEIDFIVTRGMGAVEVTHEVVAEKLASDHRPIFAVIKKD